MQKQILRCKECGLPLEKVEIDGQIKFACPNKECTNKTILEKDSKILTNIKNE